MFSWIVFVYLAFILIIIHFLRPFYLRWKSLQKDYQGITILPQSTFFPFLGNLSQISTTADRVFLLLNKLSKQCQQENKPIFCLWIGVRPSITLCSGEGLEGFINNSKQLVKSIDYTYLHPWLKTGLLTSDNEKWRTRRRLITPSFHNNQLLNSFMLVFHEQSEILANRIEELTLGPSKTHYLYPFISACTLDIIAETATGTHPHAQSGDVNNSYVNATIRIGELITHRSRSPWLWPEFLFNLSSSGREHNQCLKILHKFTRDAIEQRLKTFNFDEILEENLSETKISQRLAFLDSLITQMKIEKLTIDDIQEEVDTFMFEGHDTTAAAIYFCLFLVGTHPEVQEKIHEEIDSIFHGDLERACSIEDIQKMIYLDLVIKESLRILPSVPFISRQVQEDFVYHEQTIRKGTPVNIFIYGIHHDPKVFPDPDKFDPSRFEKSDERSVYSYIPFSAGSRNCIGQRFASLEERVVLSTLFRRFSFSSTQKVDKLKLSSDLILRTGLPIEMEIKRRF